MAALNRLLDTAQSIDLDGYSGKVLSVFRRQMLIRLKDLHLTKAPTHLLRTLESSSRLPPAALSTQDPPSPQAGSTISSAQKVSSGNRVPNKWRMPSLVGRGRSGHLACSNSKRITRRRHGTPELPLHSANKEDEGLHVASLTSGLLSGPSKSPRKHESLLIPEQISATKTRTRKRSAGPLELGHIFNELVGSLYIKSVHTSLK